MGVVGGELEAFGDQSITPRQGHRRRQPAPLALLVGHDEEDVRATVPWSALGWFVSGSTTSAPSPSPARTPASQDGSPPRGQGPPEYTAVSVTGSSQPDAPHGVVVREVTSVTPEIAGALGPCPPTVLVGPGPHRRRARRHRHLAGDHPPGGPRRGRRHRGIAHPRRVPSPHRSESLDRRRGRRHVDPRPGDRGRTRRRGPRPRRAAGARTVDLTSRPREKPPTGSTSDSGSPNARRMSTGGIPSPDARLKR